MIIQKLNAFGPLCWKLVHYSKIQSLQTWGSSDGALVVLQPFKRFMALPNMPWVLLHLCTFAAINFTIVGNFYFMFYFFKHYPSRDLKHAPENALQKMGRVSKPCVRVNLTSLVKCSTDKLWRLHARTHNLNNSDGAKLKAYSGSRACKSWLFHPFKHW